jgi:hypothetical protein
MQRGAVPGIERRDPCRDLGSPVASLYAVAVVAQATHQLDERQRDAAHVPAGGTRRFGEAVARQRGRDHVERVLGVAAVGLGVGQSWNDVEEFHDGAGPAVDDEQRKGVRSVGTRVHEVDRLVIDAGAKVLELVELRLLCSPVVLVAPVRHQVAQVADRCPVLPAGAVDLVGEAGPRQTESEVPQGRVVHANVEPFDCLRHRA